MKLTWDKTLPDSKVEFIFSDGSYVLAEQQHGVAGTPWKILGECTLVQAAAIETWTKCKVLGVSRSASRNEVSRRYTEPYTFIGRF